MTITTSSKKQYLTSYLSLIKKAGSEDLKDIFEYIKKSSVKDTTKLAYLNSIIGLKKADAKLVKGDLKDVVDYRDRLNVEVENGRKENNLNDRQSKAMEKVKMGDVTKFVDKLNENKSKSTKDLEDYLLVKMMSKYPIRNDFMEVRLTKHKMDLKKPLNSLFVPAAKGEAILAINDDKTSKTYGQRRIKIDADITSDIKKLMKDGRKYLFVNAKGQPMSSSSFSHRLNRLFQKEFGVPVSSTIMRKIFLTDKYGDVVKDMKNDADMMGHSTATQKDNYIANGGYLTTYAE